MRGTRSQVYLAAILLAVGALPCGQAQSTWSGNATYSGNGIVSSGPGTIPASLFGLHFRFNENSQLAGQPCPTVVLYYPNIPFGALRLWDTDTRWQNLEQAQGVYNFSCLGPYLQTALARGVTEVILTLSSTPQWASSNPTYSNCDYSWFALGDCAPPYDLNSDGTGADQLWRDYIYNLSVYLSQLPPTYHPVTAFEMWNEFSRGPGGGTCTEGPTSPEAWQGTCAQLVRMVQDANCILTGATMTITATGTGCTPGSMNEPKIGLQKQARILTPNVVPQLPDYPLLGTYLATTGALTQVQGVAVHAYSFQGLGTTSPVPYIGGQASLPSQWANVVSVLPGAAFGLPVWSTEGSWGSTSTNLPDANMDEGFVAQYYFVGWSAGFREMYWYAVNNSYGTLINQNGLRGCVETVTGLGCPTLAATGWTQTYNWMVGNTMTTPCAATVSGGPVYTCGMETAGTLLSGVAHVSGNQLYWTSGAKFTAGMVGRNINLSGTSYPVTSFTSSTQISIGASLPSTSGLLFSINTGTQELLVFDSSQTCTPCTTSTYTYPAWATKYYTLDGGSTPVALSGGTVAIGWKPILLSQ